MKQSTSKRFLRKQHGRSNNSLSRLSYLTRSLLTAVNICFNKELSSFPRSLTQATFTLNMIIKRCTTEGIEPSTLSPRSDVMKLSPDTYYSVWNYIGYTALNDNGKQEEPHRLNRDAAETTERERFTLCSCLNTAFLHQRIRSSEDR